MRVEHPDPLHTARKSRAGGRIGSLSGSPENGIVGPQYDNFWSCLKGATIRDVQVLLAINYADFTVTNNPFGGLRFQLDDAYKQRVSPTSALVR